jgi:hypothetical protein
MGDTMSFSEHSQVAFGRRSLLLLALLFVLATGNLNAADPPKEDPEEIEIDGLAAPDSGPIFTLCRLLKRC